MLKDTIVNSLPAPALNAALGIQARRRLKAVTSTAFDTTNLKSRADLGALDGIFRNPATESCWLRDHPRISAVFSADNIGNGVNPGDRRALYYAISALRPRSVLEIGTHIGASTIHIASALRNSGEPAHLETVDIADVNAPDGPWKKVGLEVSPRDIARRLELADMITFYSTPSSSFMQNTEKKYDLIFLDGDHFPDTVYKEVSAALKLLNPDGIIVLHDYYPDAKPLFPDGIIIHGPYLAMNRIHAESPGMAVVPFGQLPWPTKQGTATTSLAFVVREQAR